MKTLITFIMMLTSILSIPISINSDYFITANISVGSNDQSFKVQLDTGSLPLWINSENCKIVSKKTRDAPNGPCYGSNFNSATSSTFLNLNTPFSISYDDGTNIFGTNVRDTINIGNLKYNIFYFGLVTTETYPNGDQNWTIGILGLTPPCCGDTSTSILGSFFNDNNIENKIFSLYFPNNVGQGEMLIGNTNSSLYTGSVTWVPVTLSDESWNLPSIIVETESGTIISSKSYSGYIDTGTDILYMPSKVLKKLCKTLGMTYESNMGCYTACTNSKNIGNFLLNFGNNLKIEIDTQNNFIYPIDSNGDRVFTSNNCALAITEDTGYTLGAAVISQFYTIWDFSGYNTLTGRIGFAKKIN